MPKISVRCVPVAGPDLSGLDVLVCRVKKVYGIQFGYTGFYKHEWMELTMESVAMV